MRADLLDAHACVTWAITQMGYLRGRLIAWDKIPPYRIVAEPHADVGKKLLRLRDIVEPPPIINAEVGAIINSLRSSLDLLVNQLAGRTGYRGKMDAHFPICCDRDDFLVGKHAGRKAIKRLSKADQAIIEDLEPWRGGKNPLLIALHDLDITRKHRRLIAVTSNPVYAMVTQAGAGRRIAFQALTAIFENDAELAIVDVEADHGNIELAFEVTINEAGPLAGKHVIEALDQLARFTTSIINLFA